MGKRKKSSRGPAPKKKREPLATNFKCVFCSNENSVSVQLDKKNRIGHLSCKQCNQNFNSRSTMGSLTQPIDIYYEWIDACEDVAKDQAATAAPTDPTPATHDRPSQANNRSRAGVAPGEKYTDEDDGFIDDDGVDAEAEYADE